MKKNESPTDRIMTALFNAIDEEVDKAFPRSTQGGVKAIKFAFKDENRMSKQLIRKVMKRLVDSL